MSGASAGKKIEIVKIDFRIRTSFNCFIHVKITSLDKTSV